MKTKFGEYLERRYLTWQLKNGRASIREFSKWLGINQALVTQWMNGKGKPGINSLIKLGQKLGPEVYDILEMDLPSIIPTNNLPREIKDRLETAIYEVDSELASRGLTGSSPEANEIVKEIFEKHGFKYTRTTKNG